jgi:two-component system chemotaxis response regulator CheY
MKVLVVDDSRAMRMILKQILREIGFEDVAEAGHGRDALAHLDRHPDTALVLIDWNMPEMNGLELLTALQGDSRFASMRRMMVTTESEMPQIVKAIEAGASEYVMKPFTREAIKEKLRLIGLVGLEHA